MPRTSQSERLLSPHSFRPTREARPRADLKSNRSWRAVFRDSIIHDRNVLTFAGVTTSVGTNESPAQHQADCGGAGDAGGRRHGGLSLRGGLELVRRPV